MHVMHVMHTMEGNRKGCFPIHPGLFAADFCALLKTKNNDKLEVELTTDLTEMIKFEIGDDAKCECNIFSVKAGTNEKVQFLWKKRKCVVSGTTPPSHKRQKRKDGQKSKDVAFDPTVAAANAGEVKTTNTTPEVDEARGRPVSPSPNKENNEQSEKNEIVPNADIFDIFDGA